MLIDRLEPIDKRKSKVFLDDGSVFVLYRQELKKYRIEAGSELTEETYQEILFDTLDKRTRERALYFLKFSGRTEAELRQKLKAAFYPRESIEKAVEFLKEYHFLDDEAYAKNYIETCGGRKSRNEIKMTLCKKGIDRELAERLLSEGSPEEEEEKKIRLLLEKRRYRKETASKEETQKHAAFLMRKGFPYERIRKVMGEINADESGV